MEQTPKQTKEEKTQVNKTFLGLNEVAEELETEEQTKERLYKNDSSWEELGVPLEIIVALQAMGFKRPSLIQKRVIKSFDKYSMSAQSQNGSGKTLAYLVPTLIKLSQIKRGEEKGSPRVIIVCDTKALIIQVQKVLQNLLEKIPSLQDNQVEILFGGKQVEKEQIDVLITTFEQLKNNLIKKKVSLTQTKFVVIDEADNVLRTEFAQNYCLQLFNRLLAGKQVRFLMISATSTEEFQSIIKKIQTEGNVLNFQVKAQELTLKNVKQYMMIYRGPSEREQILQEILAKLDVQNVLIFGNSIERLHRLKEFLEQKDYRVAFVYQKNGEIKNSAEFLQKQIQDFLEGKYRILLTTNLLSRGIDMRKVTLVVNYNLPLKFFEDPSIKSREIDLETYLHRVGRTGRFGDKGVAINFVEEPRDLSLIEKIEEHYGVKID